MTAPVPSRRRNTQKRESEFGCLSGLGIGLLILVFWSAVVFNCYLFVLFYYPRLLIGGNEWKMTPDGARAAGYATLAVPVVAALWFSLQWGVSGFVFGAWIGVGVSFWIQWTLQDAFPGGQPVLLRSKRA